MIEVNDVSVNLGGKEILHNIKLNLNDGEKVAIVGPNGSGKTTLIKTLLGILRYKGSILLDNRELKNLTRTEIAKSISYVPQSFSTPYTFTVEEFVSMGKYIDIRNWWEFHEVDSYLEEVGIMELKGRYINTLSGGEMQKVLIARALAQESKIMLLDEPTSHLDPKSSIDIIRIISRIDRSVFAALHDINSAYKYFNKIVIINKGEIGGAFERDSENLLKKLSETYSLRFKIIEGNLIGYDTP